MNVLPKRGVIAAAATALGLALLFSFKTPAKPSPLVAPGANNGGGLNGGSGGTAGSGGTGGTVSNSGGSSGPNGSSASTGTSGSSGSSASTGTSGGTGSGGTANGTVTGPTVNTRFGPVQLQITFTNGQIGDVKALQLPTDRQRSAQISSYVAPILRQEVLTAQSAQIDLVSGATYTSYAYAQSVQAILDQAHG
jgi:uncharacterized protein with FMN-binding domain